MKQGGICNASLWTWTLQDILQVADQVNLESYFNDVIMEIWM